jgi:hypothetical protein
MPKKEDKLVDRVCYGCYQMISVPREVFDSKMLIKREYKGRTLENEMIIGELVVYCREPCQVLALGTRPKQSE